LIVDRLGGHAPFTSTERSLVDEALQSSDSLAARDVVEPDGDSVDRGGFPTAPESLEPAQAPVSSGEIHLGIVLDGIEEIGRLAALGAAEDGLERGLALHRAGQIDACIPALQEASRAPRVRFAAASLLGRIFRERGLTLQAIESFERAAEALAPSPDEGHQLLYELADLLEEDGDVARALAVCMELHADAGDYRDVSARIDRLSKARTRG
jgi:tetratricopeptide (TPR) repeat protein